MATETNSINAATTGIVGNTGTAFTGTPVTQYAVIVGGSTSSTLSNVAATATTGQVLQNNSGANPSYSTATYPAVATGTGTILRADGTNWVATTSTYPDTNAVSTILYASSANVMSALATANSGVLTTSTSGVPSIDTTNFHVLSTGVQMKGNNTNTAPPSGFIGEQLKSVIAAGSAVSLTTITSKTMTSLSLTAGVWDLTGVGIFTTTGSPTVLSVGFSSVNNTLGAVDGDGVVDMGTPPTTANPCLVVPAFRVLVSTTTTYYFVAYAQFASSTCLVYGRMSAVRVG